LAGHLTTSSSDRFKQLADDLRKRLQEAYDRGASAEATKLLVQEFAQLRKKHDDRLRELRKQVGL